MTADTRSAGKFMNDRTTTVQDLKDRVRKFREERGWKDDDLKDIAISILLESAELLEHFQWVKTGEVIGNEKWRHAVGEEAADVLFLLMEICEELGIEVSSAFSAKVSKQEKKYPVERFNPSMTPEEQMKEYRRVKASTRSDYPFGEDK